MKKNAEKWNDGTLEYWGNPKINRNDEILECWVIPL